MAQDQIVVRGARTHNLKNISVDIPRNKMVVITGLSGSGKSSLAFDTIFAEGQRRYVESLCAYARQFLGQMEKPDVDQIEGLSPAVSIDQRGASSNPRSTVGTTTEIYDYLRLLYARVGIPHCPVCGREVCSSRRSDRRRGRRPARRPPHSSAGAADQGSQGPSPAGLRGHPQGRLRARARRRRSCATSTKTIELDRYKNHTIEAVVDRLIIATIPRRTANADRFAPDRLDRDGAAPGRRHGHRQRRHRQRADRSHLQRAVRLRLRRHSACPRSSRAPFRSTRPHGACEECQGLGTKLQIDPELIVPNPDRLTRSGRARRDGVEHRGPQRQR